MDSVEQLYQWLGRTPIREVERGERNHVAFDNSKHEILALTGCRKLDLKQRLAEARITVRGHIFRFITEVTHWLRVYLDTGL